MVRSTKSGVEVWFVLGTSGNKATWDLEVFKSHYFGGGINTRLMRLARVERLTDKDREEIAARCAEMPLFKAVGR